MIKKSRISILIFIILLFNSLMFANYIEEELEVIVSKANSGDAYYQGLLGMMYANGDNVDKNYEKAFELLTQSSDNGDAIGMYQLAIMYKLGRFTRQDTLKSEILFQGSVKKLKEEAESGNPIIQFCLGNAYYYGSGIEKDLEKAFEWNMRSILQGYPKAFDYFGRLASKNAGSEEDYKEIVNFLQNKSAGNNSLAGYTLGNYYSNADSLNRDIDKAIKLFSSSQKENEEYRKKFQKEDFIIPDLLPPTYVLSIEEGSCGENCLWTILNALDKTKTQLEINIAGTESGVGLHSSELMNVLEVYDVGYSLFSQSVASTDSSYTMQRYKDFIYNEVVKTVQKGHPILIGIKVLPSDFPQWSLDHFVLLVGYNESTDELIYNDFNKRKRIPAEQLMNTVSGYSFINDWNWVYAIEFIDF